MTTGGNHEEVSELRALAGMDIGLLQVVWERDEALDATPPTIDLTLARLQTQGGTPATEAEQLGVPTSDQDIAIIGEVSEVVEETEAQYRDSHGAMGTVLLSSIICEYPWPQGCAYWIEVARCESSLGQNPEAYTDWNPYVGLFQVWIGHGYGREWLKDDRNNTLAAWELSRNGMYTGAWPWCQ